MLTFLKCSKQKTAFSSIISTIDCHVSSETQGKKWIALIIEKSWKEATISVLLIVFIVERWRWCRGLRKTSAWQHRRQILNDKFLNYSLRLHTFALLFSLIFARDEEEQEVVFNLKAFLSSFLWKALIYL